MLWKQFSPLQSSFSHCILCYITTFSCMLSGNLPLVLTANISQRELFGSSWVPEGRHTKCHKMHLDTLWSARRPTGLAQSDLLKCPAWLQQFVLTLVCLFLNMGESLMIYFSEFNKGFTDSRDYASTYNLHVISFAVHWVFSSGILL